jgi:enoyl-[acyl-carrier protein] reductase II
MPATEAASRCRHCGYGAALSCSSEFVVLRYAALAVRTSLTELLEIEHPVIQASLGPWSSVALAAAVSEAGGIGSLGTALMPPERVLDQIRRTRELTEKPFIVNHTRRPLNEEAFELTLRERPKAVSLALGEPGDLAQRAHDAGCLFINQVHNVEQAVAAVEQGADALIAQGEEAGGFGGGIGSMALIPQVVEAVTPIPVAAAGGIVDGRRLAAALLLGAAGVNIGTRFLAANETEISEDWKERIVDARSEDTVRALFAEQVFPPVGPGGYDGKTPRVLRTDWVDRYNADPQAVATDRERLAAELVNAVKTGRSHELVPFTGQTAGMIDAVQAAGEIVTRMVAEAEELLARYP